MTYQINYKYWTGNSFGSQDAEGTLEMEWQDLEKAKAALKRIEEHYRWYEDQNKYSWKPKTKEVKEPEWHRDLKYDFQLKVALDNGNEVTFCAPWCGYFEGLYGASIVTSNDGMSFEI